MEKKQQQILTLIKGRNSVANLRKTPIHNSYVDLVKENVYIFFFVSFCQFLIILTSIKDHISVANLRKMMNHNPNVDLVNKKVYTTFCLILSIPSQDIEQKPNYI